MAKKVLYIEAEENEQIVKYEEDYCAYSIDENLVIKALVDDQQNNVGTIIKVLKEMELSSCDAAKIILQVIGTVIEDAEYAHEAALLKAAKSYCQSVKKQFSYGY